ncbi:MAG: alpha/beta hydrolase [Bacillota bacterium]
MKINLGGIELFYEKIGVGKPLLFLHGNGEDHHIYDCLAKALSTSFTLYLIDSRGHGKSTDTIELHYPDMAEDIYFFIKKLNLKEVSLFGFSDGAIIGLLLASKYPNILIRMIVAGGNISPEGIKCHTLKNMKKEFAQSNSQFVKMMLDEPNITLFELDKIEIPTMIISGQNDVIKRYHTKLIHRHIKNSTLHILLNHTHDSYVSNSDYLKDLIAHFL